MDVSSAWPGDCAVTFPAGLKQAVVSCISSTGAWWFPTHLKDPRVPRWRAASRGVDRLQPGEFFRKITHIQL
ncbi:hypothetical protein I79_026057 [Cricetulus griseus]|uniref:Uncharacterized protein n=1 Tax=Cricetulus griseus TaxID=10029 RepID=G3IPX2_CRIGR|nr:hypothetical protein I79_026057 [Cricetulus griseus]